MNPQIPNQPQSPQNFNAPAPELDLPSPATAGFAPPPTGIPSPNFGAPPPNSPIPGGSSPDTPQTTPAPQPLSVGLNGPLGEVQTIAEPGPGQPPTSGPKVTTSQIKVNPNSTQNALQIAEIRDGLVIMNDGSFRSVLMVKSINFDLMSQEEREAVEYSYQGFLNSLYFPIQIYIHSRKVDLGPYIQKLDKIRSEHDNMLLALLMEDYIGYMSQLAQQTNIMDKKFYVVIPYFPTVDMQKALAASKSLIGGLTSLFSTKQQHVTINEADLEKGKTELRNRVQSVLAGLMQCGVQGLPLDTQELIELYYDVYNPDTATRQELKNFDSLTAPVITRGQGQAPQPNLDRELQ